MSTLEHATVTSKGKEGIPSWNGAAESFQAYQEAALLFEQTTPYQKRYLCGPKLQSALEGAALRLVVGKRPDWLSDNNGVTRLLEHLRSGLGRPQMPELTDLLNRYFRSTRRKANETMNEYVTRKAEVYVRAQQAMQRVQPVHGLKAIGSGHRDGWPAPYWGDGFPSRSWWRSPRSQDHTASAESAEASEAATTGEDDPEIQEGSASDLAYQTSDHWSWSRYHQWQDSWSSSGWDWGTSSQWSWRDRDWARAYEPQESYPELVPEFVQAWLLLTDAGLESSERNLILTAIQGDLTLSRVAQELRNHFPEGEIKKREPETARLPWRAGRGREGVRGRGRGPGRRLSCRR